LHIGVEAGDEDYPGPWDLSNQGAATSGGGGQLVDEGSRGLGLALRLLAVRGVQSCVRVELGELVEQALGSPLQRRHTRPQDAEDGKKDS
jgi:hypothetical protein